MKTDRSISRAAASADYSSARNPAWVKSNKLSAAGVLFVLVYLNPGYCILCVVVFGCLQESVVAIILQPKNFQPRFSSTVIYIFFAGYDKTF